jgi:hypothetical protein
MVRHARYFVAAYRQYLEWETKQTGVPPPLRFKPKGFIFPQKRKW